MKERNYSIDFIKGILIISVVLGHILLGLSRESFPRYMIYSVHMPLFIGMSGYLMNFDKLKNTRFLDLIRKYFFRVGIPWIIAVNVYFVITNWIIPGGVVINRQLLHTYIKSYVTPYYHLWYVEKFLEYVLLTWVISRILYKYLSDTKSIFVLFGVAAALISGVGVMPQFHENRMYYYIFFILGMIGKDILKEIRQEQRSSFIRVVIIVSVLAILGRICLFFTTWTISSQTSWYYFVLNIPLLILVILCCEGKTCPRCRFVEFLGKESLAVYL